MSWPALTVDPAGINSLLHVVRGEPFACRRVTERRRAGEVSEEREIPNGPGDTVELEALVTQVARIAH